MSSTMYNRIITQNLKIHGLTCSKDAFNLINNFLLQEAKQHDDSEGIFNAKQALDALVTLIKKKGLPSPHIDAQAVNNVFEAVQSKKRKGDDEAGYVQVIDAFETPRFEYIPDKKIFDRVEHRRAIFGTADDKARMFRERLLILRQRLLRHESFAPATVTGAGSAASRQRAFELTDLEALISTAGHKCVLGMLSQLTEGRFYLEDHATHIPVSFVPPPSPDKKDKGQSESMVEPTGFSAGFLAEGCIVMAEGEYLNGVFHVKAMALPPPENRLSTLKTFPQLAAFGLELKERDKELARRRNALLAPERREDCMVFVADLHLDKPKVLSKLKSLFEGLAQMSPVVFVLMGDFVSVTGPEAPAKLKTGLDTLADLVAGYPTLARKSKFILMPGPNDPGLGNVLPRAPLSAYFAQRIKDKIPNVVLASNPCRLMFYDRELVLFRDNLTQKMRRNSIVPPQDTPEAGSLAEHLVKTVAEQGHLCPLPPLIRPIYWNFDHALRIYPLPHVLVLADSAEQYETTFEGCLTFNPGSFSTDYSFILYKVVSGQVEFSRIPA